MDPITPEELARLDEEYVLYPQFAEWPTTVPRELVWDKRLAELNALANRVDRASLAQALDVVLRAAAFDTGAIEGLYSTDRGLTMTVATQAAAWERALEAHGGETVSFFDAQLATYQLVLDVATQRIPVTEAWIRRIHEELTKPQETYTVQTPVGRQEQPLTRGQYKQYPNHVQLADGSRHAYAPVDRTRDEMARLVANLESEEFAAAHPVLQAAYAHYSLVAIHPFADGNGRVARALASVYLYRAASVPLLVFADQRLPYFDALSSADAGDRAEFVAVVNNAAIAAVELVAETLRSAGTPSPEQGAARLRTLVMAQGGLTHTDIDLYASNLLAEFQRMLGQEAGTLSLPSGITISVGGGQTQPPATPDGFRALVQTPGQIVSLSVNSAGPAAASRNAVFRIFISKDLDEESDLFWIFQEGTGTGATFSLTDIYPQLSAAAEQRMRMLSSRILGIELAELSQEAERSLRNSGYV